MISRRALLGALAGSLLATPLAAEAQLANVARVGILSDESPTFSSQVLTDPTISQTLRDLGWVEGQNVAFQRRYSSGENEILPGLAAELVRLQVDVIVAIGTPAALAAKNATGAIPIVLARTGDPVRFGLVQSLARPGGNVTGVAILTVALGAKRLDLLRQTVPGVARVGVLWDPSFPPAAPELKDMQDAAQSLRLKMQPVGVQRAEDFEDAVMTLTRQRVGALIVVVGRIFSEHRHGLPRSQSRLGCP